MAMKLTSDTPQYINPQVQLNIEFPQTKSRICCSSKSIKFVVKISPANHSLARTKNYYTPICTVFVMNVSSGVLLEDFRSQASYDFATVHLEELSIHHPCLQSQGKKVK